MVSMPDPLMPSHSDPEVPFSAAMWAVREATRELLPHRVDVWHRGQWMGQQYGHAASLIDQLSKRKTRCWVTQTSGCHGLKSFLVLHDPADEWTLGITTPHTGTPEPNLWRILLVMAIAGPEHPIGELEVSDVVPGYKMASLG